MRVFGFGAALKRGNHVCRRLLLPWSVLRGGGSPTYSGYMIEKTHIPRIGFKFIRTKFRTNFGYMDFYKPITTVRGSTNRAQRHTRDGLLVVQITG